MIISASAPALKLAPDLSGPSELNATYYKSVTGVDASAGLTEVLGLSGKWSLSFLRIAGLTLEEITIKLTIDGVVIWNDTFTPGNGNLDLIGYIGNFFDGPFVIESDFSFELQTLTDTSVTLQYGARPIA